MSPVLIVLLFLLNALLMPLVVELVKERAPGLALRVIRLAVRLLPRAHRERYRAEWTAELDEMQRQTVSQLASSLRILLGAPSMGWVLRVRDRQQHLAKGGRARLIDVKVVRKIFVALLTGGWAYFITDLLYQPTIWVFTVAVLTSGITFVVQFMNEIDRRLGKFEKEQADAITQLMLNSTRIRPDSSPLVYGFAQLQINQVSQVLKGLSEGVAVSYDGADRDWLLELAVQSRHTIDAISLTIAHAYREVDGGLWNSDLGQRYLELQRDATRREVVIRRIFLVSQSGQANQDNLLHVCRQQKDLGIHVRVLGQSDIPHAMMSPISDFVVFDSAISYEVSPASHGMKPTTVKTHLVLQSEQVKERIRQFELLWSAAREIY